MAGTLQCTLTTPEEKVFEGDVRAVVVPATDGELGILPRHAPLIGSLGYGELRIDADGAEKSSYFVQGGFLQIVDNQLSILAASAVEAGALVASDEEAALRDLESKPPATGASLEERDGHTEAVGVAKARLKLASRSGG